MSRSGFKFQRRSMREWASHSTNPRYSCHINPGYLTSGHGFINIITIIIECWTLHRPGASQGNWIIELRVIFIIILYFKSGSLLDVYRNYWPIIWSFRNHQTERRTRRSPDLMSLTPDRLDLKNRGHHYIKFNLLIFNKQLFNH